MQTGVSRLEEPFTAPTIDWKGLGKGMKPKSFNGEEAAPQGNLQRRTEPGPSGGRNPGCFPEKNAELLV